jgi:hypothetical protein
MDNTPISILIGKEVEDLKTKLLSTEREIAIRDIVIKNLIVFGSLNFDDVCMDPCPHKIPDCHKCSLEHLLQRAAKELDKRQ